ncbi:tudor domain-containing 6 [Hoplias malabaricus]|uniref:tudor domain-containing 6 n=1 Tax=Hoplias malabaricus TaxID=27720 RepID=UPI003461BD1B
MCSIPGLPSPGSNVSVLITRVNLNPLCILVEFWGNFDEERRLAYQQMRKEIQYPRQEFLEAEGSPGDLCLVRVYETWYRARIVSRNADDYSVFLIDEGRTLRATTNTLAWGQTDFFYLPPEVEFCVLANVLPLSPEYRWSKMALEFMKTFSGKRVTACVQDVVVPQRTFLLDIPYLSKQMYEMGFAKKLSNERFKEFVARSLQSHSASVEPQITVKNEPVEHKTEKKLCYMYPELQTETVETVIVTEVTNPLRIFCQLKVFSQELRKLTEHTTQYYEGKVGTLFARPENLGTPCASRGKDGKWYRSLLQQVISSSGVAEVLHVDYGKKQFVQTEHVSPLAPEFFRMPVVTYVCSLHGIIDKGVGWTATQIDFLKSLLLNRTVIAKFEYQSLSEGVHYVTLYGDENLNINHMFGLTEKCLMDTKAHGYYAVHKSSSSQKCDTSVQNEKQSTNMDDLKGKTPVLLTESLSINTSYVAVVQHVDSPGKFWIQTQKHAEEFDKLMEGLEELYSDLANCEGQITKPVPGLLCVAKSQDGVFYRAAVCKVKDEKAEVFFLDYGNTELVDCLNLRELPLRFQNLPALAVRCALYGIQPCCQQWDQKSTLFFSKAIKDKVLDVHVLAKSSYTHVVQVIDSSSDGEKDLTRLMCGGGFADSESLKKAMDKPVVQHDSKRSQTYDMLNTVPQSSSSPATKETRSAFTEYLFSIGSSVEVIVSYINSPNDFWCQKVSNTGRLRLLMQDLQDYYLDSEFQPFSESACVARHPENGMWYRALVIQKHQTSHVSVLFVDYGQTKKVGICNLRRINPSFLRLNGQAFRCSLYNPMNPMSHSTVDWGPDATSQFKEFVDNVASLNVNLKCTVYAVMYDIQKVLFNVVDLETPFQSVCSHLVQRCLANHAPSKKAHLLPFRLDTYYYSTHGVKTGSEEEVTITSVKSVNHFFCHLRRNSAQIEELADKVNSLCNQLENINCPKDFGKVCFAKYTDGLWYRGQITSTKPSVLVNFVDYGNSQETEISDLLPVPFEAREIMSVPVQAIEGGLSDMPENVPSQVNNWFENFVTDRHLKALVVAKKVSGKIIVELYDGTSQVNAMIREKFHIEREKIEQIAPKKINVTDQNVRNGIEDIGRRNTCLGSKAHEKHEKHLWGLKETISQKSYCWKYQKANGSAPDEHSKKFQYGDMTRDMTHTQLSHDSVRDTHSESANVSGSKPSVLKEMELPLKELKPGMEVEVFISHYNSPLSFFVQLLNDESDICSLVERLNDNQSKCVTSDIHEGDLVGAVFPDDNCWYRAVVRKPPTSDTVEVEFLDFGNTAKVSVSNICILDRSLFSHPRYSIHCSLAAEINASELASIFKKEIEKNADSVTCTFIKELASVWEVRLEVRGRMLGSTFSSCETVTTAPIDVIKSSVTVHKQPVISCVTFYKNPSISYGENITVYASFITGPQLFWCQYTQLEKLQEISDTIQEAGNAMETGTLNEESLPVGSGCIALYHEDKLWYRAKVISRDDDTLSVLFVDYGNESKVKMREVRPLPSQVNDLPPQAFACQLDGFDMSEGSWNDKAADRFFELISDQLLNIKVVKFGSLHGLQAPHFIRLECGEIVINDAMKNCWIPNGNNTSLESTNASCVPSGNSSICIETETFECTAESTLIPMEHPQEVTEYRDSDVCISTIQHPEMECNVMIEYVEESGSVIMLDKRDVHTVKTLFQDETELKYTGEPIIVEDLIPKDNPELTETSTGMAEDSNVNALNNIHENLQETSPQKFQVSSEKGVLSIPEHERNRIGGSHEFIKSDLGYLRAAETHQVGSKCIIWSHAHKNWCRAQILKISEDSTLVLLLDYDSEVMVDPCNIFEIIPVEHLQVQNEEPKAKSDLGALIDEVNRFTEDLIDFASDTELDVHPTCDDMLQEEIMVTKCLPEGTESGSDGKAVHPDILKEASVTHLTLKVQNTSDDDVIFVKEYHAPLTEASEPCDEE